MKLKFTICYDGNFVKGWNGDKKNTENFIKNLLEDAFFNATLETTEFFCSGRTDAGVHAINQICHCDYLGEKLSIQKIRHSMNNSLPRFITILDCSIAQDNFHARFSTTQREYMYLVYISDVNIPLLMDRAKRNKNDLNLEEIKKCMIFILGQHDFSTFCPSRFLGRKILTIDECFVENENNFFGVQMYKFIFKAKSFAHHQIRNLMGGLLAVGNNKWTYQEFIAKLQMKNRQQGGEMVSACGLYFVRAVF